MSKLCACLAVLALVAGCGTVTPDEEPPEEQRSIEFYNHNAQAYYDGRDYLRSYQQFEKALELEEDNETALLGRAWALLLLSEGRIMESSKEADDFLVQAKDAFDGLAEYDFGKNNYKVALGLGKVHVLFGDLYDYRVKLYEQDLMHYSAGDSRHVAIQKARSERENEYNQATIKFNAVLAEEDNPEAKDNLTALIQLARISIYKKEYGAGMLYAGRYLEQVRRSKELWVDSITRYPEDKVLWEAKLARAVAKEIEVRDLIANTLFKMGQFKQAESELDHVILLAPERGDAFLNRGIVREKLGDLLPAVYDYRRFFELARRIDMDPSDPRAIEATKRLTRVEKKLGMTPTVDPDLIKFPGEEDPEVEDGAGAPK